MVHSSHFKQLANLITVRDICENVIAIFDAGQDVRDVFVDWWELCGLQGLDPMTQVALVEPNQQIIGLIGYESLKTGSIFDCMEQTGKTSQR